ncbi:MAG: hypothetical protein DRP18_02325 [Candidatus Aenigmatarchaeota archaeon]|nr:MAG: hypothetical protein DRP18_02325 [Candidatus Aenigmarchaeota archaeon]
MGFKVGVTSGLYYIARAEELGTMVRKLGYTLTRGTSAMELALDVPHEITETEGEEMRHIAKKQGVDLLLHGSLTIPMCIPERTDWRDAQDHMEKSVRSAVYAGCKYVNFHSCLNIWLELMTYTSRKLTMSFCDHEGRFISKILKESEDLREWFVRERWSEYAGDVLSRVEHQRISARVSAERGEVYVSEKRRELAEEISKKQQALVEKLSKGEISKAEAEKKIKLLDDKRKEREKEIIKKASEEQSKLVEKYFKDAIREKLRKGEKWESEELRAVVGIIDGYHIMAHYMFYTKDPIWVEMTKYYKDVMEKYKLDYNNKNWLDEAWKKAEEENDRKFKEFFYGVVGAKFLEGHIKRLLEWMEGDLIHKELKGKPELIENAKKLQIAIETPDARDPAHAGLYLIWHPVQIYVAVKMIRKNLKTNRVWMLQDFEHAATQGIDPIKEMEKIIKIIPDFGELTIAVHSNAPNPGHSHLPLEIGDVRIYKLLYYLMVTGFGKKQTVYLIYERGGGDDPFKQSVEVLKLCVKYLERNVHPDDLPPEFFGVKGLIAGDINRQRQIIEDHLTEPLKDLLEVPEEEWGFLSSAAQRKGKLKEWEKGKWR